MSASRLFAFDRRLGKRFVCGSDEAGRGSLAGPICGAGVCLDQERIGPAERRALSHLADSKKLSASRRESLRGVIFELAAAVVICTRSHIAIDKRGIEQTNREVLSVPLMLLGERFDDAELLVDGLGRGVEGARALVGGDGRSAAIACASIIAKTSRDHLMQRAGERWPEWELGRHSGYGTAAHRQAIRRHGPSPLQRLTFKVG